MSVKISTRGRYAARIMVCLAGHAEAGGMTKYDIAEAEGMTPDYVAQILMRLKSADLVVSRRGKKGGFALAKPAGEISMADVLNASEGPLELAPCVRRPCRRAVSCVTKDVWDRVTRAAYDVLEGASLKALADEHRRTQTARGGNFDI